MVDAPPHFLLLEPYYGGSHGAFIEGLQKHLPFRFTLVSLPARKWKMRMQLAAPWMAAETCRLVKEGAQFDAILCSSFIDVATLRVLLAGEGISLPVALYFHENQFAYPNRAKHSAANQFTALNFTTALAADTLAFNSNFNRETFMDGVTGYLKKATDMDILSRVDELREKSHVLYPGIDFSGFAPSPGQKANPVPVVAWNHRWEHDKDPETFFKTLADLSAGGIDFKLIVLGQHFTRCPEIFARSWQVLQKHIVHFGYAPDKTHYIRLLNRADIVVSTALHEFFGMAVLEAVRCGCRPLVPDRLSYRELFPRPYRYPEGGFARAISRELDKYCPLDKTEVLQLTDHCSWPNMAGKYKKWLLSIL
jgi:glycosyltransferase involved in cell wall biosynthesis